MTLILHSILILMLVSLYYHDWIVFTPVLTAVPVTGEDREVTGSEMVKGQPVYDFFGENIGKGQFEDEMIMTAEQIRKKGVKSIYELQSVRKEMSPIKDKYIFISILGMHASVVVIDKELFDGAFFTPSFGQDQI